MILSGSKQAGGFGGQHDQEETKRRKVVEQNKKKEAEKQKTKKARKQTSKEAQSTNAQKQKRKDPEFKKTT